MCNVFYVNFYFNCGVNIEANVIWNDDCRNIDKYVDDESIDLSISSPPYNQDFSRKKKWFGGERVNYSDNMPEKEYRDFINECYDLCVNKLKETGQIYINIKSKVRNGIVSPPYWILELPFAKRLKLRSIILWKLTGSFDRPSQRYFNNYEYIFHFSKGDNYTFNEKNLDPIWDIGHVLKANERTAHIAQFPERLVDKIIKASTNPGDLVLEPFSGSATVPVVATKTCRNFVGFEIKKEFWELGNKRLEKIKSQKKLGDWN